MRIKAITPIRVTDAELARRQARYQSLSPAGIDIELVNLPAGSDVPRSLESVDDIAASDRLVAAEIRRSDARRYDAVLPDCVLDPGLSSAAGDAPVPVFGILQLAAGFLVLLGHKFAAMTRNEPIGDEFRACLKRYGLDANFDDVAILQLSFDDIEDDVRWNTAIEGVRSRFADRGVQSVVNGCSAVSVTEHDSGVAVIDPTRLALQVLGVAAEADLVTPARPAARR